MSCFQSLFCGVCSSSNDILKYDNLSVRSIHSTAGSQRARRRSFQIQKSVVQRHSNSNSAEYEGLLHIQRFGLTEEELEWRKSVVVLADGVIEIVDLETDSIDKFDLKGYSVSLKVENRCHIELTHPQSFVTFRFEIRDEGTSWLQFRGKVIFSNGLSIEQWLAQFTRNIQMTNKKKRRRLYSGPYHPYTPNNG